MDASEGVYDRYEELLAEEQSGALTDKDPNWEELCVLRALLMASPGKNVTFEASFGKLLQYADSPTSDPMRLCYDRTVEAWMKVSRMIGAR
jgi:hypothetical protein